MADSILLNEKKKISDFCDVKTQNHDNSHQIFSHLLWYTASNNVQVQNYILGERWETYKNPFSNTVLLVLQHSVLSQLPDTADLFHSSVQENAPDLSNWENLLNTALLKSLWCHTVSAHDVDDDDDDDDDALHYVLCYILCTGDSFLLIDLTVIFPYMLSKLFTCPWLHSWQSER